MDVKKLIERLKCPQMCNCPMDGEYPSCWACQKDIKQQAAADLEKLQAENEKLRTEKVKVIGNDELMDELQAVQAENDKLRADVVRFNDMLASYQNVLVPELRVELERVKAERDAALNDLNTLRLQSGWQCFVCDNADATEGDSRCNGCNYIDGHNYKWRGPQKKD